tara:strand:- start:439 stop:882 length:444 start_codon:yes stop_codon:yes gene_type:complete
MGFNNLPCDDLMKVVGTHVETIRNKKKYKNVVDEFKNVLKIVAENYQNAEVGGQQFGSSNNLWEEMQFTNYMCYGGENQHSLVGCFWECEETYPHIVMNYDTIKKCAPEFTDAMGRIYREVYKPLDEARDAETLKNTIIFCNYDYEL